LDTSNILGRGAVKDTYNLLSDGIVSVVRALAERKGSQPQTWASEHQMQRYFGSSVKGEAAIDWDSAQAREQLLTAIVSDADQLLEMVRQELPGEAGSGSEGESRLRAAAALLGQLLLQDIERGDGGDRIRPGVARDRIISVHDPEMRHGRKSAAKLFDGYKAAVAVDGESGMIVAAAVLAGNAADNEGALELVQAAESNAQVQVEETVADCAYGDGMTRQEFAAAGRKLVAKVPAPGESAWFGKEAFAIDPQSKSCICPAGERCTKLVSLGHCTNRKGERQKVQGFEFEARVCRACALRAQCVRGRGGRGRTVRLHPQEALLQEARALQHSEGFLPYRRLRQAAEHRLARLMQLGLRQARYFGRAKTLAQLLLAATVANLTLVATEMGLMKSRQRRQRPSSSCLTEIASALMIKAGNPLAYYPHFAHPTRPTRVGFHPDF
jgi:hypothetical protein